MKNDMPNKKGASPFYRDHVKRVIDLVIAIPVFIIAFIPMIIIGIAVKLDSPGPILFKQDRIGKNGKVFSMLKFRSMCVGAEKKGSGVYSGKGDARVTKVGRIIRATSLDELPQLINVLRGDSGIIGTLVFEQPQRLVELHADAARADIPQHRGGAHIQLKRIKRVADHAGCDLRPDRPNRNLELVGANRRRGLDRA